MKLYCLFIVYFLHQNESSMQEGILLILVTSTFSKYQWNIFDKWKWAALLAGMVAFIYTDMFCFPHMMAFTPLAVPVIGNEIMINKYEDGH